MTPNMMNDDERRTDRRTNDDDNATKLATRKVTTSQLGRDYTGCSAKLDHGSIIDH